MRFVHVHLLCVCQQMLLSICRVDQYNNTICRRIKQMMQQN